MSRLGRFIYNKCRYKWIGSRIINIVKYLHTRDTFHRKLHIENHGLILRMKKEVMGGGNFLIIGNCTILDKVILCIRGNNNKIIIGKNCRLGKESRLYLYGNNMELIIGDSVTFTHHNELLVQEDHSKIEIGEDCMFSHHINVRTSDSHPIYDLTSSKRSNNARNVKIGKHVWVAPHCIIQKGVNIGEGSIIATNSIVTKDIPENCIAAGMPAKIVRQNVKWERHFQK